MALVKIDKNWVNSDNILWIQEYQQVGVPYEGQPAFMTEIVMVGAVTIASECHIHYVTQEIKKATGQSVERSANERGEALREALGRVRESVVIAIAFLNRDKASANVQQVVIELVKADALARAALATREGE